MNMANVHPIRQSGTNLFGNQWRVVDPEVKSVEVRLIGVRIGLLFCGSRCSAVEAAHFVWYDTRGDPR